ncbi:MAG: YicC family protein [Clostridia bacterium]|nr:YicC family protein [Clostridia bacterium]
MKSMTGYGKYESTFEGRKYFVEIKSVNSKYLDFNIKIPRSISTFEEDIKQLIAKKVSRGKIEVNVRIDNYSEVGKDIKFDDILLNQLLTGFNDLALKYNIENNIKMSDIINIDGIVHFEQDLQNIEYIKEELLFTVNEAINKYIEMKTIEGNKIKEDILLKLSILKNNIDNIAQLSYNIIDEYKAKIEKRLNEYIISSDIDKNRILTEIILFADKMTIDEEIIRFNSHIMQFNNGLNTDASIGKKLDFILQEMNRETNTIGSKTNKLEITQLVIDNKGVLENIREQIQNIE